MSEIKGTRALELWCKRLVKDCPEIQIENMTTSWRNGMAFCALVHHFRPDLIDMSKLKPENIYENNQLAFSVAEKHLGIPALLDPEDMVENDVPDRLSVLTYLSQFYQRLGHTVNTKVSESENKTASEIPQSVSQISAPLKFGKTGLDKCTACGLPVYLAQRLMVSHKLYHRRCFRCSKCSGHLNPKNLDILEGSEFTCDSCKNEKNLLKYLNNNDCDQMGMLAFGDSIPDSKVVTSKDDIVVPKAKPRTSILEKINMFEQNSDKDTHINSKIGNLSLKDTVDSKNNELSDTSGIQSEIVESQQIPDKNDDNNIDLGNDKHKNSPDKVYKSNIDKFNFLQTQLTGDSVTLESDIDKTVDIEVNETKHKPEDRLNNTDKVNVKLEDKTPAPVEQVAEDKNITDDIRISKIPSIPTKEQELQDAKEVIDEIQISVPPRRKKLAGNNKTVKNEVSKTDNKEYPDHLNPFGTDDEEEENDQSKQISAPKPKAVATPKKESTNPFGSSDEEDDEVPPIQPPPKVPGVDTSAPARRLIAVNPFWSDGEEPSSDDDDINSRSTSTYTSLATSTPNLRGSTPRRKKPRAPPPPALVVTDHSHATSMDDVASISSLSSLNSTAHSDQRHYERTPIMKKKRPAPTPPESLSAMSECGGSLEKGVDSDLKNASGSEGGSRRLKGPAPGLPLPERREVKLQMSPEELQVQLDLLETQQLGLERQGVLIERMIRDKCEGDEACTVPQEEVEDLVIQLCELVNEKNDLFRKQTELMYIRRQQRLEQEQADIEHEIRIIQSRPAVNRIDADKVREEQLVSRLVEIVRLRDELVQQLDAERRRERQEDLAIAASIASKRAQRNSDSNTLMKSAEVSSTHKKSKVKDKVKKQLKKAKHTLISKKKDDTSEKKDDKIEKEKDKSPKICSKMKM